MACQLTINSSRILSMYCNWYVTSACERFFLRKDFLFHKVCTCYNVLMHFTIFTTQIWWCRFYITIILQWLSNHVRRDRSEQCDRIWHFLPRCRNLRIVEFFVVFWTYFGNFYAIGKIALGVNGQFWANTIEPSSPTMTEWERKNNSVQQMPL